MSGRVFIDTNILVYADDRAAGEKAKTALAVLERVLRDGNGVLSTQVLQEFFVIATRKLGIDVAIARRKVELLARLEVVPISPDLILGAIDLHRLHQIAFWDALIVKAAAAAGCKRLLSEDLQHGAVLEGVRVENPFLPAKA